MLLLVGAGTAQELLLQAHRPGLGVLVVTPALIVVGGLWLPSRVALLALALAGAVELLVPVMTGGGMVLDWVRHYELSLRYAGRPSLILPAYVSSRTALSEQVLAAFLAHVPQYWVFQAGSLLLNGLWMWPATLILRASDPHAGPERLLVLALSPLVLYYTAYSWPWALATFFLLGAVWLAGRKGRAAAAGVGVGSAAALLVHPGMLGYVLGLGGWLAWRRRGALVAAVLAGVTVLVAQLPWVYDVTSGRGVATLVLHSDPGQAHVPLWVYAITRPMLAIHTVLPFAPLVPGLGWADLVLTILVHSLPGALLVLLLVAPRALRPAGLAAWVMLAGATVALLIYPAEGLAVGILDALFPAVVLLQLEALPRLSDSQAERAFRLAGILVLLAIGLVLGLAWASGAEDRNVQLRGLYSARYLVEVLGPAPGILLLAAAVAAAGPAICSGRRFVRGSGRKELARL
ncbi:MAG: hypothetical protein ABR573_01775 [Candidatus Dormibacteria bacterium]